MSCNFTALNHTSMHLLNSQSTRTAASARTVQPSAAPQRLHVATCRLARRQTGLRRTVAWAAAQDRPGDAASQTVDLPGTESAARASTGTIDLQDQSVVQQQPTTGDEPISDPALLLPSVTEGEPITDPSFLLPGVTSRFEGLKVLVAGATGRTGRRVVEALQAQGVPVRALVRDPLKFTRVFGSPKGVDSVKADVFQYATLPGALADCNAVVVCTGFSERNDPFGPFNVDYQGTLNLIALAKQKKVKKFVLVTSIGVDDVLNPLNLLWGVLFWKKRAEEELQRSGLDYTIVRPGGLKSQLNPGEQEGAIMMEGPGAFGFPPMKASGSILRSQVAEVVVESLVEPAASDKVVEIIARVGGPKRTVSELFSSVHMI